MNKSIALLLPIALLAAGCALEPKKIEPPETRIVVQPAPASESELLLAQAAQWRKIEPRELALERDLARAAFQREKSDLNRVRMALLLSVSPPAMSPAAAAQEDAEVLALLEPLHAPAAGVTVQADARALASLLHAMVSERRKMREQLRDALNRLSVARKDDVRDAEARALKARVEELEARLDALKSIDRSVNSRSEPIRK